MNPQTTITGILMAGGKSSRMGEDKGLLPLGGLEMVGHSLKVLRAVCDKIILVANNPEYERFGIPVFPDLIADKGPVGGIYTGLRHIDTAAGLVVACDMPGLRPALLEWLIQQACGDFNAVVPVLDSKTQPLCAVYHRNCVPLLQSAIAEERLKLRQLITEWNTRFAPVHEGFEWFRPDIFHNLNTPAEFEEWLNFVKNENESTAFRTTRG